jgi:hypothetical protein
MMIPSLNNLRFGSSNSNIEKSGLALFVTCIATWAGVTEIAIFAQLYV